MENYNRLIEEGCIHDGNILIPPSDKMVPVDIRRLKNWTKDRTDEYIKAINFHKDGK